MRTRAELIAWVEERIAWARRFAPHLIAYTECGGFGWLVPVDIACDR